MQKDLAKTSMAHNKYLIFSQPKHICPQDVLKASSTNYRRCPLKILFDHPGDALNWTPWGRLEMTSRGRPNLTSKKRLWEFDYRLPLDIRWTFPRQL